MLLVLLRKGFQEGFTLLESFSEELLLEEFTTVGVLYSSCVDGGGALRLPVDFSQSFVSADEVLMEGVVLTAHNFDFVGARVTIAKQENEALSLQGCETHFVEVDPDLGDSVTVVEVVFGTAVTCGVLFVDRLNIETIIVVLKLFPHLFLASQLVVEGILNCRLLPLGDAVVRHVVHLGCIYSGVRGESSYLPFL